MNGSAQVVLGCLLFTGANAADMKCPPMPDESTKVMRDVSSDIRATAGKLGKVAAAEVALKTDVTAKAVFEKYPSLDKLVILQTLSSTYCSALNTSGLTGVERADRWERFMERYLDLKSSIKPVLPPEPKAPLAPRAGISRQTKPAIASQSSPRALSEREKYRLALELATGGNSEQSIRIFKELAESGHARSQYQLGRALILGDALPQSYAEAFKWFSKAAKSGLPSAQHNLAVMYQDGLGTSQDQNQALVWFAEAARGGFLPSQDLLTKLGRAW